MDNNGTDWPVVLAAVFTGLTVLAVLFSGLGPYIASRAKVRLLDVRSARWYFVKANTPEQEMELQGTLLRVDVSIENEGETTSYISGILEDVGNNWCFRSEHYRRIKLEPSTYYEGDILLWLPARESASAMGL